MQGCTPLHAAAATEKAESVRLLLTYGADVGAIDKQVSFGRMMQTLCCTQIEICDGTVIFCVLAARYITRLIVELMPTSGVFSFHSNFIFSLLQADCYTVSQHSHDIVHNVGMGLWGKHNGSFMHSYLGVSAAHKVWVMGPSFIFTICVMA